MLAHAIAFSPSHDERFFTELPAQAAVFALRGHGEPYISKTANLRRRLQRLLSPPAEHSKRLNLRELVSHIDFALTGSDFESQFLLYTVLRKTFPNTYAARLRLRPAPLIKLHLENEYPRASVTTRPGKLDAPSDCGDPGVPPGPDIHRTNLYYGPFPSRTSAEKFASDALDFFKMRRCVDDLHPDPSFPGCVYSEMKMCLAPCFKGCTDDEYHSEVGRVQAFFDTAGESLTRELAELRESASTALAFEEAAAVHAKIEKLNSMLPHLPEIVRRLDQLDAIIIQPSSEPDAVCLFRFRNSHIAGPIAFRIELRGLSEDSPVELTKSTRPKTLESRVEEKIQALTPQTPVSTTECVEHLAILKRWYYRSHRVGEIFFGDPKSGWPYRRIVRGIGRVHRGEKHQELAGVAPTQEPGT